MSFCEHCQGQRFDRARVLRALRQVRQELRANGGGGKLDNALGAERTHWTHQGRDEHHLVLALVVNQLISDGADQHEAQPSADGSKAVADADAGDCRYYCDA